MHKLIALFILLTPFYSIDAMVRTGVEIQAVSEGDVEPWGGPGYYYGYWFDNEDAYYRWVRINQHYNDGVAQEVWIGPGLYYGVWFGNEYAYHRWYHHHHHGHYHHGHHHHHHGGHHHGGHHHH